MLNSFALELKKNNVCAIFRIKKKKNNDRSWIRRIIHVSEA